MANLIRFLKKIILKKHKNTITPNTQSHVIIPREQHTLTRKDIHAHALKVLYRLHHAGFAAYLVGGCVRDLLLGYKPKDFDIATNARPEEIRKLFKNSRIIGKRFRLVHVVFGHDVIEVATFRTHHEKASEQDGKKSLHGMILRDNVYGTIEDDAWRRDFRMNALYYNIADFSIVDYTGGMDDIQTKTLKIIGDAEQRYHEDPVRLLRAVRLTGKLNLTLDPETEAPIGPLAHLLTHVSPARLYQEVLKLFHEGASFYTITLLRKYHLFKQLFAQTEATINTAQTEKLLQKALCDTDQRIADDKSISPAFLFAVFLWPSLAHEMNHIKSQGLPLFLAIEKAIKNVLKQQIQQLAIPRHIQQAIHDIFLLQYQFQRRRGKEPLKLINHPRFRAAYDLLLLRQHAGEAIDTLTDWWTTFYSTPPELREKMLQPHPQRRRRRRKRSNFNQEEKK